MCTGEFCSESMVNPYNDYSNQKIILNLILFDNFWAFTLKKINTDFDEIRVPKYKKFVNSKVKIRNKKIWFWTKHGFASWVNSII